MNLKVTGTSQNIGAGITEGLAAEGAAIVAVDALAENAIPCTIAGTGGGATGTTCDVTDESQVKAAVDAAL
jgi:NAD(P)-dependent dehydrogenase (short-subunit alcohol dehydrogenase family)